MVVVPDLWTPLNPGKLTSALSRKSKTIPIRPSVSGLAWHPKRREHGPPARRLFRQSLFGRLTGYEDFNDAHGPHKTSNVGSYAAPQLNQTCRFLCAVAKLKVVEKGFRLHLTSLGSAFVGLRGICHEPLGDQAHHGHGEFGIFILQSRKAFLVEFVDNRILRASNRRRPRGTFIEESHLAENLPGGHRYILILDFNATLGQVIEAVDRIALLENDIARRNDAFLTVSHSGGEIGFRLVRHMRHQPAKRDEFVEAIGVDGEQDDFNRQKRPNLKQGAIDDEADRRQNHEDTKPDRRMYRESRQFEQNSEPSNGLNDMVCGDEFHWLTFLVRLSSQNHVKNLVKRYRISVASIRNYELIFDTNVLVPRSGSFVSHMLLEGMGNEAAMAKERAMAAMPHVFLRGILYQSPAQPYRD